MKALALALALVSFGAQADVMAHYIDSAGDLVTLHTVPCDAADHSKGGAVVIVMSGDTHKGCWLPRPGGVVIRLESGFSGVFPLAWFTEGPPLKRPMSGKEI